MMASAPDGSWIEPATVRSWLLAVICRAGRCHSVDASMLCQPLAAGTPRSVFGRFSGVKGCLQSLRGGRWPPLTPGASAAMAGQVGQAGACPRGARRPAREGAGACAVRLLVLGWGARW
jgi:hypothetical protein